MSEGSIGRGRYSNSGVTANFFRLNRDHAALLFVGVTANRKSKLLLTFASSASTSHTTFVKLLRPRD